MRVPYEKLSSICEFHENQLSGILYLKIVIEFLPVAPLPPDPH
jgi:hypothetical protein